jgi:outer membrane protein assembly factor BamB
MLWQETVVKGPLEELHQENTYASGTPATDGERIYVAFRVGDDIIVAAHDVATGGQLWLIRPGTHKGEWGFSNSPVLYKDKVILDCDSKGDSFLIALNRVTGETIWRHDRTEKGISYSAPLIREIDGRVQLIQCGNRCVTAFDPDSGEQLWTVDGPSQEFVATPVYSEEAGLVFISSSWPMSKIMAIRPNGRGNVTETHVAWSSRTGAPYTPSMIVVDEFLMSMTRKGDAFCFDAKTGEIHWQEKLGRHHASPVLINGLLYLINDNGQVNVIRPAGEYQQEARYELGESCYASPAISDGQVFVRGFEHLYCFGQRERR